MPLLCNSLGKVTVSPFIPKTTYVMLTPVGLTTLSLFADAPQVEQEQTFIHTNEYDETEVICIVHASPRAEVTWFKNGSPMSDDEGILNHRGNRYALILPGIKSSTFGQYKCKATNKFGSDEKTTEVSGNEREKDFLCC